MSALDANEIMPGLWVGSVPNIGTLREAGFDVIAVVAEELVASDLPIRFPGVRIVATKLKDRPLDSDAIQSAIGTARVIFQHWKAGRRVLVACQMGINRSALVAAMVLHLARGISGAEAVQAIRRARPGTLTNPSFLAYLLRLPRKEP